MTGCQRGDHAQCANVITVTCTRRFFGNETFITRAFRIRRRVYQHGLSLPAADRASEKRNRLGPAPGIHGKPGFEIIGSVQQKPGIRIAHLRRPALIKDVEFNIRINGLNPRFQRFDLFHTDIMRRKMRLSVQVRHLNQIVIKNLKGTNTRCGEHQRHLAAQSACANNCNPGIE